MKEYEVNLNTLRQYTNRGESPIIVFEDVDIIRITTFVGPIAIFFIYEKLTDEDTLIFKEQHITNKPQVIYVMRENKTQINFKIGVDDVNSI